MAGHDIPFSKHSWNGITLRRAALAAHGLVLPNTLGECVRSPSRRHPRCARRRLERASLCRWPGVCPSTNRKTGPPRRHLVLVVGGVTAGPSRREPLLGTIRPGEREAG
jgi:hypothetical protein